MKEKLFKITIFIISAMALIQLALSHFHIKTMTKLFTPEVGFYLFLFIIFGLVTLFNASSIKKSYINRKITKNKEEGKKSILLFIVSNILSVIAAIVYLRILINNYKVYDSVTYQDIYLSLYLVIAGVCVYVIGAIIVLITNKVE
ncbi:hypothetical protein [Defluviitalea phaphyphila]|uniref:hypothetical protein n=1 Tax=Defluviitalea phaphyphila TaxID=1473580 RepID=UPI0007304660|nr:hypothetical protein [Defluviitalea phaphyphila]